MKYEWEMKDIRVGRKIHSSNLSEQYIIGYDPSRDTSEGNMALVSLKDGMICMKNLGKLYMANYLNESNMKPDSVE